MIIVKQNIFKYIIYLYKLGFGQSKNAFHKQ
jgi:hypothetical protein